jgi:hypothetical protein
MIINNFKMMFKSINLMYKRLLTELILIYSSMIERLKIKILNIQKININRHFYYKITVFDTYLKMFLLKLYRFIMEI